MLSKPCIKRLFDGTWGHGRARVDRLNFFSIISKTVAATVLPKQQNSKSGDP